MGGGPCSSLCKVTRNLRAIRNPARSTPVGRSLPERLTMAGYTNTALSRYKCFHLGGQVGGQ